MNKIFSKRSLLIVGFVLIVIALGYAIYKMSFGIPSDGEPTVTPPSGPGGGLPTSGTGTPNVIPSGTGTEVLPSEKLPESIPSPRANGGLTETTPVVTDQTAFSNISPDGQSVFYYQPSNGTFNRITNDGTIEPLSDSVFHNVQNAVWSPNQNLAVLEYPDGSNIIYDFDAKKQKTLPKHWQDFSFNPDGKQLAFESIGLDPENRWLAIANVDGSGSRAIANLGNNAHTVTVDWSPNKQMIAYQKEAAGADSQEIFFIGLEKENFKSMVAPGLGVRAQWTPSGQQLLYSASSANSGYLPLLWIAGAAGDNIGANRHSLGLNTWADKCTFASNSRLICAVPNELQEGSGLAPDVANTTPDTLYNINLETGAKSILAIPSINITAQKLNITKDGQWLFITDKTTNKIYKIAL